MDREEFMEFLMKANLEGGLLEACFGGYGLSLPEGIDQSVKDAYEKSRLTHREFESAVESLMEKMDISHDDVEC